jgi:AcrR family transcriptional regulator
MNETRRREPLSRERVIQAAVRLADREGLGALTMRRLGAELGVEAMSLYKHVSDKDAILDGIVEQVVGGIELPTEGGDWRDEMRRRAVSARDVLAAHSWAIGLLESRRSMGPAQLRYVDATLGSLRAAGFSIEGAAHAFWLLDSYVYGHVIQETSMARAGSVEAGGSVDPSPYASLGPAYPHLVEVAAHAAAAHAVGAPMSFDAEFQHGLEVILGALAPEAEADASAE